MERQEPVHRLGRRRPDREGPRRGGPRRRAAEDAGCCPTSCTPRCSAARSPPPTSRSTPPTGTGSPSAARGGSTSATTARCRARTRSRPSRSTARSSSCCGAAPSTPRRRRSTTTTSSRRPGPPLRRPRRRDAAHGVPQGRHRPVPALLAVRHRAGPAGRPTVLVAAHGNSLRALVKHLDDISDEDIAGLNIPTGMPLVYRLDEAMTPTVRRRGVPRPRGRRRGRRRGRQPGPLSRRRRATAPSALRREVGGRR